MTEATMSYIQQPSDADIKHETVDAQTTVTALPPLKRRVHDTGVRHGKAFGSIGMVTTTYTKGFVEGFVTSFKE